MARIPIAPPGMKDQITDVRYREPYGEVRSEFFRPNPPASTLVQIGNLAIADAVIEIEAVVALDG